MIKRIISAIIAILYITLIYYGGGGSIALKFGIYLLLPLACIWYSEEMGAFGGNMYGHSVTAKTPGCLVAFGGWILLLLPLIIAIVATFSENE